MLKIIRILFLLTLLISTKLNAQVSKIDSLSSVIENYSNQNKSSVLFIHFDKNIYTNNDQVWFTGYVLKSLTDLNKYNTLYLSLVSNADSSVVHQQKFIIDNGYSFGSITLPDSLQSGNYKFIANTNIKINGKADAEFIQPITIKSTTINPLITSLSRFNPKDEKTGNGIVLLKVLTSNNRFVPGADVNYTVGRQDKILKSGRAKTTIIGELMIDYPADKISLENNLISVVVRSGKHTRYDNFEIPLEKSNPYQVSFYPEGGYMVSGIQNNVGWEVKDAEGTSVSAKAIIFSEGKAYDTISTNSSGLGKFYFNPEFNRKYTLKLLKENKPVGNYEMPESLKNGMNIKLNSAIGNNELRMLLESNVDSKAHLIVHNYENISLAAAFDLTPKKPLRILLKLDSVPTGISTITLLDKFYRPVAERVFFAHYDSISQIQINTDKDEYATRDSVKLKLKIVSRDDDQIKGAVSLAVVQANRLILANKKNIVDYSYLEDVLGSLPPNISGTKFNDRQYLDDVLLVKSWRRYKWPVEKDHFIKSDTISEFEYSGQIFDGKKALKKPLMVNVISDSKINIVKTDSSGKFVLPFESLITDRQAKIWLNINDNKKTGLDIKIKDPFDEIKTSLKKLIYQVESNKMGSLASNDNNVSGLSGIKLNEVTIRKSRDNSLNFASYGRNSCGDYVCQYGILNCQNHSSGTMPVKGKSYSSNGRTIVYQGCLENTARPNFLLLNGISYPKAFYMSDIKNKNEPINFATIYWNYQSVIDKNEETSLTFNTGDLTGEFKIIIQGLTEKGPVYGEKTITIKK